MPNLWGLSRARIPSIYELGPIGFPLLLMAIGILALGSTIPRDQIVILYKQILFDLFGLFLMIGMVFLFSSTRQIEQWSPLLYGVSLFGLVLVEMIGRVGGGSRRWLDLGWIHLQPSEFMKAGVILLFARLISETTDPEGYGFRELLLPGLLLGLAVGLILFQPDLGSALLVGLTGAGLLFIHGIRRYVLIAGLFALIACGVFSWKYILKPYQKHRIIAFLDPYADPLGKGYHLIQSQTALGSGGLWGKPYGTGLLSRLEFLPEHHTDFIFASFGEIWGFAGGLLLLGLYAGFFTWLYRRLRQVSEIYPRFVLIGVFLHFLLHTLINLGMVVGLLPVVGIPLPWVSYGGSATVANAFLFGYAWYLIRLYGGEGGHHILRG
jgi:rod shape determining protein RodA